MGSRRRAKEKKEEELSGSKVEENHTGRRRNFKPPVLPLFHSAAESL